MYLGRTRAEQKEISEERQRQKEARRGTSRERARKAAESYGAEAREYERKASIALENYQRDKSAVDKNLQLYRRYKRDAARFKALANKWAAQAGPQAAYASVGQHVGPQASLRAQAVKTLLAQGIVQLPPGFMPRTTIAWPKSSKKEKVVMGGALAALLGALLYGVLA